MQDKNPTGTFVPNGNGNEIKFILFLKEKSIEKKIGNVVIDSEKLPKLKPWDGKMQNFFGEFF